MSDLHLESQDFSGSLAGGDVLILAGDLCHARCLDVGRTDKYSVDQRDRVHRFVDQARRRFAQILLVAGNHEHYDGVFDETIGLLRNNLPGVTVLDDEHAQIGGVCFFGATLWTDFDRRSEMAMNSVRRRMGEYFFVKKRRADASGGAGLAKFRPEDAADAFEATWAALLRTAERPGGGPTVVITHHAPSSKGLNPAHVGNGLDRAYASDLDAVIAGFANVPYWVHGHTHIQGGYRIGATQVLSNARGFAKEARGRRFDASRSFEV